jgi:excisionase family DNA binding protein
MLISMQKLFTTTQAAESLGVTQNRVLALISGGRLKADKIGMQWLIQPSALAAVRVRKTGRPKKENNAK